MMSFWKLFLMINAMFFLHSCFDEDYINPTVDEGGFQIGNYSYTWTFAFNFLNPTNNTSSQSGAYSNDKLLQFYGNSLCEIYDYKSGALIESRTDIAGGHCSCAFFEDKINSLVDEYPILWISDGQPSTLRAFNINVRPAKLLKKIDLTSIRAQECIQCVDFKTKTGWNITYVEGAGPWDGKYATSDYIVHEFDLETGLINKESAFILPRIGVLQAAYFVEGKILLTTGWDGDSKLALIDTEKKRFVSEFITPHIGETQGIAIDDKGNIIITARGNNIYILKKNNSVKK